MARRRHEKPAERAAEASYAARFRKKVLPSLKESSVVLIPTGPGDEDPHILRATELGLSLLMGKPLVVVIAPGQTIPPGLRRAADVVIENFGADDESDHARLRTAISELANPTASDDGVLD